MAPTLVELLERGGVLYLVIGATSVLMWTLIIERYWFLWRAFPGWRAQAVDRWRLRAEHGSWYARRVREGLLSQCAVLLERGLVPIQALTVVLPMLGLLGTVLGMIETFDSISAFGSGHARGMAAGISKALLTTLAGLVTALSGMYFSVDLRRRAALERQRLGDALAFG